MNSYKIVCESFNPKIEPDERIIKSYPFITVSIYKNDKLETKKRITARLTLTDKKLIVDRLSTFLFFPIPEFHNKKIRFSDVHFHSKKVDKIEVDYIYVKTVSLDEDRFVRIDTVLDNMSIVIKSNKSDEILKELSKLTKKSYR